MTDQSFILSIDQGTTGSRALLVDRAGQVVHQSYAEFSQHLPNPGWVEHDAMDIWHGVQRVIEQVIAAIDGRWEQIHAIGITNQRETCLLWSRQPGLPVHHAIVWQDRRTADRCAALAAHAGEIADKTGLVIDPYFSATKIQWLLDHVPGARADAAAGSLCAGTMDSWLIWQLTAGRAHKTDFTNASRTMLLNIHRRQWDDDLLSLFNIPRQLLPQVCEPREIITHTDPALTGGRAIPIAAVVGDQQAALFAQQAWQPGQAKNTYGTGAFLLMNIGTRRATSSHRLLLTLACDETGAPVYALEGSIFVAGASVQWLRDGIGVIASSAECDAMARSVPDNGSVYFVPAFVGLGAPHWRSDVRGAIFGLTRGTRRAHLVRAALEAIAYQTREVLQAMQADSGLTLGELHADGGASSNDWLMQFQSDALNVPVIRASNVEMTALGAAYLAGLVTTFWSDADELRRLTRPGQTFTPGDAARANDTFTQWQGYLNRLLS